MIVIHAFKVALFVVLFKIFAEGGVLRKLVEVSAVEDDVIAAGSVLLFLGFEEGRFRRRGSSRRRFRF